MKGILNGIIWVAFWTLFVVLTAGAALVPLAAMAYFTFAGAQRREEKASEALRSTLMRDEQLISEGLQHRIFALWRRRILVAITNSRILVIKRGLFGGFRMQDIQWKDLVDAKIEQNVLSDICGSNLVFKHSNANVGLINVDGVASEVAAEIYSQSQAEEQAWEEKRRVRVMEERRAAAGGVIVHTAQQPMASASAATGGNRMLEEIEKAKKLLDMGAVSDSEYQEMKSKILGAAA